jgi:hypothetical protein
VARDVEVEVDPEIPEDLDPATSEVTRPSDLGFPKAQPVRADGIPVHREIEVEAVDPPRSEVDAKGYVEVRMAETIEEFTYGNPHYNYRLEEGKRYRLPVDVANYLHSLGYIYTR